MIIPRKEVQQFFNRKSRILSPEQSVNTALILAIVQTILLLGILIFVTLIFLFMP